MIVYPTMMDETTKHFVFRSGREDRVIPVFLCVVFAGTLPLWWWVSGPFFWPWGVLATGLAAVASVMAFFQWRLARRTVAWFEDTGRIEVCRGKKRLSVTAGDLVGVEVCPASVRTKLVTAHGTVVLSHRFLRVELLLDRLRTRRPDLFPDPGESARFRFSLVELGFTVLLAVSTVGAGFLVYPWGPWAGVGFWVGAAVVLVRALFFVPVSCTISPGRLIVRYAMRRKRWGKTDRIREDSHSSGGAVFFRMRLLYGSRSVVLDEGSLRDPLRPLAGWVCRQLAF